MAPLLVSFFFGGAIHNFVKCQRLLLSLPANRPCRRLWKMLANFSLCLLCSLHSLSLSHSLPLLLFSDSDSCTSFALTLCLHGNSCSSFCSLFSFYLFPNFSWLMALDSSPELPPYCQPTPFHTLFRRWKKSTFTFYQATTLLCTTICAQLLKNSRVSPIN